MSEQMMEEDDDSDFNVIKPTLLQQLKTILDQYPDDGQILKELIQNAEDAGATEVKFLYDKNSYSAEKLYNTSLAKFQGPALYAYNDAQFTKDDWEGIRKIYDSNKVKDPMKVGRFGLGFKSVFHLTDLPSILSDSQIGFIDPHEMLGDSRTGFMWRLKKQKEEMDQIPDQFHPFKGVFDCDDGVFTKGFYNGTLFRFPLRDIASSLSETLYSDEKMQSLFGSFIADAHLVLLFLRNLEKIELYIREKFESEPKIIFHAKITEESLELVRRKRKEFQNQIEQGKHMQEPVAVTYPITIETQTVVGAQKHSFLTTNYCCGVDVSPDFEKLLTDKDLSYLPSVGVAMALRSDVLAPPIEGHVFCALPLPVQKNSMTGLPVHVNGFFALNQNRHYIKTPNADEDDRDKLTDKKQLLWNRCLMEEALPKAYVMMITEAINTFKIQPNAVYRAWPNIFKIDQAWLSVQKPFFEKLVRENVIATHCGRWLKVEDVLFNSLDDREPRDLLLKALIDANQNVASLPEHVLKSIKHYRPAITEITPSLVRHVFKASPSCYRCLNREEKLFLLKYVLKCEQNNFVDLIGLELLPTASGTFIPFSDCGDNVYICTLEHPLQLLPGMRNWLLDPKINKNLQAVFEEIAGQGCTQLRRLCKDEVPALLKKSLPSDWFSGHMVQWFPGKDLNHPPKRWLESLWIYLRDHFKEDLSTFESLPLIPLDLSKVPIMLTKLTNPSRVLAKRLKSDRLDGKLSEVLKELGVILIKECPTFLLSHPAVLETFVHPPRVHSVLKAMAASSLFLGDGPGMHSAIMLDKVKDESKRYLRKLISKTPSLSPEEKTYVSCLPIFETLTKVFVSKKHGLGAAPEDPLPVAPKGDFIDVSDKDSRDMAGLLEIGIPTLTEFVCDNIFPDVGRRCYSEEDIDKLMSFVIERYHVHLEADDKFEETMRALPFVPTNSGRVVAEGIFDPREALLQDIFADEDVFPVREPYLNPQFLVILEKLGMKSEEEISVHDLLKSAKKVTDVPNSVKARQKSEAIMAYLEKNPRKLKETFSGKDLGSLLCDIKWVSALRKKPHGFPKTLHLYGETAKEARFYRPTDVTSEDKVNLIGTVMPIVKVHSQLAKHFGWNKKPRASDVVKHLKTVSIHYTANEKAQYIEMVKEIYSFLDQPKDSDVEAAMQEIEPSSWIWNGDGFSSSKTILTHKAPIDLLPYIFSLPSEVKQYSRLFTTFGMQERCEPLSLLQVLHQIKEKYLDDSRRFPHSEVKKDLQISVDILNEIKPDVGKQLPSHLQEKVLIPTHVEGDSCVRLVKVEDCMYCEHEWLERGNLDEEVDYLYVHPNVPNSTAELLQVPTLTNRMLKPDEMQIGDEFGQEEKLTDRLRRLLEEYTDGFSVLKELIQNADDAGATEVKFLYDKRNNKDAQTCLIDEGMRECQGPALWVYNDAEFRDDDFTNITKLNGRTKETKTEKIGKFGLGFNAVYNLTDVPMFLSRNYFVIFDPSTLHLGKAIRNKSKPGMKIDVNKNTKRLRNFKNQFKPFNGIFGCDLLLEKEDNSFNGTLFRFPLRTRQQAAKSEIKNLHYNDEEMRQLLKTFYEKRDLLLLFTQNVIRVGLYSLPSSSRQNPQPKMLFQVTKSLREGGILRELSLPVMLPHTARKLDAEHQKLLEQTSFLQAASLVKRKAKGCKVSSKESCVSSLAVDVECHLTNCGASFFKTKEASQESCTWLVVSSIGKGEAMEFARKDPSLVPSAGIAVQLLRQTENVFLPSPVTKKDSGLNLNGTIFCYLPLPMHSGLPVHMNGAFAVTSNRRHLQEKLEDDKDCYGVKWNTKLMEDSITSAYFTLLQDVKSIVPGDGSYAFHSLWPKECEVQKHCSPVLTSFYKQLATGSHTLFSDGNEWFSVNQVVFLHPNLRLDPKIGDISFAVFQQCTNFMDNVVDLPAEVFHSLVHCKQWGVIESKTYDIDRFFCEIFFPNISAVSSKLRDVLVLYALDQNKSDLDELLKSYKCIPVAPSGKILKLPKQLINPTKRASTLFCQEDGRFPCNSDEFRKPGRLEKLEDLGMLSDELPWEDIAERAESIPGLNAVDNKAAVKRVRAWLKLVEKKLKEKDRDRPTHSVLSRVLVARFLPVLEKPTSFPLHWKGNEFHGSRKLLAAPKDIFLEEKKYQVCCTEPIVGLAIPEKVKELFDLEEKEITTHHAMKQLEVAFSTEMSTLNRKSYEEVSRVCAEAYSFLQEKTVSGATSFEKFFTEKRFILVGKTFLSANQVAFEVKNDFSPYLQRLPDHFRDEFADLMKVAGVKEHFENKDYIFGLQKVKRDFGEMKLDERALQVAINMAIQLSETLQGSNDDDSEPQEKWGALYLPDFRGIMRDVHDLCYKDCPWMPDDPDELSVHEKIPWSACKQLGVKTRREGALQHHDAGFPFGQKEELTNRLKRILMGYPGEKEILKELLQNADDAQATEICFIKDPRHHPDEKVFRESWKPVQGPSLCVYNNKPFTTADIEGICKLGEGSKGEDPNKTGQYGVGFNAVYHLTDVPSFISKGEEIGDVLCVFDPHCKYIPGASNAKPGRMFKGIEELRSKFPDVFPCYLEEHFPLENATMFRFPLKSEKMAKDSLISQTPVSMEKLEFMMKDLKKELFEVLLFANNVKKIGVASIDESGNLQKTYSVQVSMSNEDERERQTFAAYINKIGREAKEKAFLPTNIKAKQCTYTLTLQDNFGKKEKWLIVQQVGLEKRVKDSINVAFKDGNLGMLPRGGVACLLDCNTAEVRGKKKAYCFLPLPFETDLPVHINGHFALDHEARRSLWRDEAGGYRSDWNNALLCDVVASCYLTLLHKVRGFLHLPFVQNRATHNDTFNRGDILKRLTSYENLFPVSPIEEPYWRTLVNSVFQEVNTNGMRLLPLVRPIKTRSSSRAKVSDSEKVQVTWLPPTGGGKEQAFFNDLDVNGCFASLPPKRSEGEEEQKRRQEYRIRTKTKFEETLLETGFNLLAFSLKVYHAFSRAGVPVRCISPLAVLDFYKSICDPDPHGDIGVIPCDVSNTPFKDQGGVIRVLKYCRDDEHFLEKLPDLPLLLTQDNVLRRFSESDRRCLSQYADVLPLTPSLFVNTAVRSEVFGAIDFGDISVFQPFDVNLFASQLTKHLPEDIYRRYYSVRWRPDSQGDILPNHRWIYRVWEFLRQFTNDVMKKTEVENEKKTIFIRNVLSPLSDWNILPATEIIQPEILQRQHPVMHRGQKLADQILVSLKKAETVLDFTYCGESNTRLVEALRNLGLPELNKSVMLARSADSVPYIKPESYEFAHSLVATLESPHSLILVLKEKLEMDLSSFDEKLTFSDAIGILEYFSRNIESLETVDQETLRKLPFYPTATGNLAKIKDRNVFLLPGIPKNEMNVVESRLNCLFLDPLASLSKIFEFLQLQPLPPVEVYLKFVLKCFKHLSVKGKLAHLRYLRQLILFPVNTGSKGEERDNQRLLDCLTTVEFIPSIDGIMQKASNFYAPDNEVFRAMLTKDMFPPDPFGSEEWLPFLKKIGLVEEVSEDQFYKFAIQVAQEAETARTEKTYRRSEVLVRHLFSRSNVVGEFLLNRVCDVPFVAGGQVKESLRVLCAPFGQKKDSETPFIAFKSAVVSEHEEIVWSKASLLPRSADPRDHRYELALGCPHRNVDQYLNDLFSKLKILKKPLVDLVVSHCKTICLHLESRNDKENASSEQFSAITRVMESIYKFLQENAIDDLGAKIALQTTRCILIEKGKKSILPSQAVLDLYEKDEIKPFLYGVPPEFGKFRELFEFIGCSKYARPTHYAMVLEMLQKGCKGSRLNPNEVRICSKAVKGFFDTLQEEEENISSLSKLYLPAMPPGCASPNTFPSIIPVTLHQATDLIFDDSPTYSNRIRGLQKCFVLELSLMNVSCKSTMVNFKDLMMKLPLDVQPKMLSSVVNEKRSCPEKAVIVTDGTVNQLKRQLSTVQFGRGIARIIRDVNSHKKDFNESVISGIEKGLRSIDLCAVNFLETSLFYNGVLIPGSTAEVPSFEEKLVLSDEEIRRVYINTKSGMDDPLSTASLVTNVIVEMYGESLGKKAFVISDMLRYPPSKIWSLLDRMGIRKDDSYVAAEMDIYPDPGTLIPIEDHHLLNDAFELFEPDEYVGCQLDDPGLHLNSTFIYAIVIDEVSNEDADLLTKRYKINIGHDKEPAVVNSNKLYQFHCLNDIFEQQLNCCQNRQEVLNEVTNLLKKSWELPQEEKLQIIKRLCLRWHPEKNLGNEEFYKAVLQHIKNEVSRLGGCYDDLFAFCEARAREHGSQRKGYRERFSERFGSWGSSSSHISRKSVPPSLCERNPQPEEAKRWFRQAEADLEAGAHELAFTSPSFEWACFKCHQAAEKALKAAQYGVDADKIYVHNLVRNCHNLGDSQLTELANQLESLVGDSTRMRYPDRMAYPKIPKDVYNEEKATKAFEIANKIVRKVGNRLT